MVMSMPDSPRSLLAHQSEQVQAAIERERERIARDIHDGAAQQIATALHRLEFVARLLARESGTGQPATANRELILRELERACEALEVGLNELRASISSLLPPQLEEQNLDAALRRLLDEFALHEPDVVISYENARPDLVPSALSAPLFRFVQEALHNVRKHAHASRVIVRIRPLSGLLVAEVRDDGAGFDPRQTVNDPAQHFGLRDMRERITAAGGRWHISSKPGAGTTVKAIFPIAKSAFMLTNREREVLRLLATGLTNRAIAEKLSISVETVKSHVHHIMQKLQVGDRTQAAVVAMRLGLL
jgi:signal transduction histidine kinase/DNA-binding CsgD family transcriptional regulator